MILQLPYFSIDLSFWGWVFNLSTFDATIVLMAVFGWVIWAVVFISMGEIAWRKYREGMASHHWDWVVLAVDVPPLFVQTHKAVEQIFAHLSGAHIGPRMLEIYWQGKKQKWFSFEIVSLEGYIQFLVRVEAQHRDLVEAAIYAQYPEAEITEVEDYVKNFPAHYPNMDYDIFGIEFSLAEKDAYPIRTYPDFEYTVSKDVSLSDPMGGVLENFSRLGPGENLWLQIIIEPTSSGWKKKGIKLVKELIANAYEEHHHDPWYSSIGGVPKALAQELMNVWHWDFTGAGHEEEHAAPGTVQNLSPGLKDTVAAIEQKISKIGFKCKIRSLYVARHEVYNPDKCMDGMVGALSQFHIQSRNGIVPYKATKAFYLLRDHRLDWKKTSFYGAYKKRKLKSGCDPYVLNIEELASVWHFPLPSVKTPMVQKSNIKKAEPPANLPVEMLDNHPFQKLSSPKSEETPESKPEEALPYA